MSPMIAAPVPAEIGDYLVTMAVANRSVAYFKLTFEGRLLDWGGALESYGVEDVREGSWITEHLFFMDALLPFQKESEQLFCIKFENDHPVDVHLFSREVAAGTEYWLLLLDATRDEARQLHLQQKSNEFSLLRQRYAKLLQGNLRRTTDPHFYSSAEVHAGNVSLPTNGCQRSSILVVKCNLGEHRRNGKCQIDAQTQPQDKATDATQGIGAGLRQLNAYLSIIAQIVGQEGGLIHHVFGDTAIAIFGLLPTCQTPSQQAADAAQRILLKCQDFIPEGSKLENSEPEVGIVIATSESQAGVIQSQGYRALHTLGENVERALRLSDWSRPGVILIDGETFEQLDGSQHKFDPSLLLSKRNHLTGQTLYAQNLCS